MYNKKYTPYIGSYLCLTKYNEWQEEIPYKVIDITNRVIALQQCKFIDRENKIIQDDEAGMIILLSWHKKYGWCWRENIFDDNPLIIAPNRCLYERVT